MPIEPDLFERGDLITADRLNRCLQKLFELESRIETLEGSQGEGTALQITRFSPASEQRVDRTIEIFGRNFEVPSQLNSVTIGGVPVTEFSLGTTSILRVRVPDLPATPVDAIIQVSNRNGRDSRLYRITPAVPTAEPDPTITTIGPADNPQGGTLNLGDAFIVSGTNFAANPSNNIVILRSSEAGQENFERRLTGITAIDGTDPSRSFRVTMPADIPLVREPLPILTAALTRPDQMVYVYRLQGYEEEWLQTREPQVEYANLPTGIYTFQVKAVDRDLNYSEPATTQITIHPPYVQLALRGGLGLALVGLVIT